MNKFNNPGGPWRAAKTHYGLVDSTEVNRRYQAEKAAKSELYQKFLNDGAAANKNFKEYGYRKGCTAFGPTAKLARKEEASRVAKSRILALEGGEQGSMISELISDASASGLEMKETLELAKNLDRTLKSSQKEYVC